MNLKQKKRVVGLGSQVAEALTTAILEGEFKGGDQLIEQELQSYFGVSRSPLREAFRDLEKKGLVSIVPRKGTYVKSITKKDIEDHFPVRAALEGLAAGLAHSVITELQLEHMETELLNMKRAVQSKDTKTYYTHHLRFQEIFISASGNELLIETLTSLRMQNLWHRFSFQYYQEGLQRSYQVHREIFDLFHDSSSDTQHLRKLVENHIHVALDSFLQYLKKHEKTKTAKEESKALKR